MLPPGPTSTPITYEVSRDEEQLFTELKGLGSFPKIEIFAENADSFFTSNGISIVFTRDGSSRAVKLKLGQIEGIRN